MVAVLQEGCVAPSADDVQCAALGISTLLRNAEAVGVPEQLAGSVLDGINQRLLVNRRTDEAIHALQTALSDCLRGAPASVAPTLLNTLRTADSWQAEALAKAFWLAPGPGVPSETEWLLMVLEFLGDQGVDSYARAEVADAASHATQNHPWLVHPHWRRAFDTLEVVWKQLEDNPSDVQLRLCVDRVALISRIAASDAPDEALSDLERRLALSVSWSHSSGEFLAIAAGLADDSLARLTRVVPLLAAFLQPQVPGEVAYGAIKGCEHLVHANAELLPNDLVDLLAARVAWDSDPAVYHLASLFGRARFGSVSAAKVAFDAFQTHVRTWCSTQTPSFGHLQQAMRALHNLAAQHESLRQPLFDLLVECSQTGVHEFDQILDAMALAAMRYKGFGDAYLTAWADASQRRGFLAAITGEWPYYDENFKAAYQLEPQVIRSHAVQLTDLAVRRGEVAELRTIAGLNLSVGAYDSAAVALDGLATAFAGRDRSGYWRALALQAHAYSEAVRAELAMSQGAAAEFDIRLAQAGLLLRQEGELRTELDAHHLDAQGQEIEEWVQSTFFPNAEWLRKWADLRVHWHQILQADDVTGHDVQWLRSLADELDFATDEAGRECWSSACLLLDGAQAALQWDVAGSSAVPDSALHMQAAVALVARAGRVTKKYSGTLVPAYFAAKIEALIGVACALSPATGAQPLVEAIGTLPMPVPRGSLPFEKRWGPRTLPSRRPVAIPRMVNVGSEPERYAKVAVELNGRKADFPASVGAAMTYELELDLNLAKGMGNGALVFQASSILPTSMYTLVIPSVSISREQRRITVKGVLGFDRPQAPESPPHQLKLLATLTGPDGTTHDVRLFGEFELAFQVGASELPSMPRRGKQPSGSRRPKSLSDEEAQAARALGFKCLLPFRVTSERMPGKRGLAVWVGCVQVSVSMTQMPFLLRLIRALREGDGWYPLDESGLEGEEWSRWERGRDQAVHRLRTPFGNIPLEAGGLGSTGSHTTLIERSDNRIRLSVPPALIDVEVDELRNVLTGYGRTELEKLVTAEQSGSSHA